MRQRLEHILEASVGPWVKLNLYIEYGDVWDCMAAVSPPWSGHDVALLLHKHWYEQSLVLPALHLIPWADT